MSTPPIHYVIGSLYSTVYRILIGSPISRTEENEKRIGLILCVFCIYRTLVPFEKNTMSIKTKITDCNIGEHFYELRLVSEHKKVGKYSKEWEQRQIDSFTVDQDGNTYVVLKCLKQSNVQARAVEMGTEDVTNEIKLSLGIE